MTAAWLLVCATTAPSAALAASTPEPLPGSHRTPTAEPATPLPITVTSTPLASTPQKPTTAATRPATSTAPAVTGGQVKAPTLAPVSASTPNPPPTVVPSVPRPATPSVALPVPVAPAPVGTALAQAVAPAATETSDQDPGESTDETADPGDAADGSPDWRTFVPTDVAAHLATMDRAARNSGCGVPWQLLAAIARVESDFGRNMATSSAGAVGYGQFLPSSWTAFGNAGNVYDYRDALPAIASYLCVSGVARDPRAALFAYNHADWYVDMVLELAGRYDRMAPGAPIPGVLDIGPAADHGAPMQYGAGRDVQLQTRAHTDDKHATWLGVPWRGRAAGVAVSRSALDTTALQMVRGAFGLQSPLPVAGQNETAGLDDLANRAWSAGLLPLRGRPQASREIGHEVWSMNDLKAMLAQGQPVVVLVSASALPGHPSDEAVADQPLVLIGTTADGLIYSDPSFSSSLGYGLVLNESDFVKVWDSTKEPRQAIGFAARPRDIVLDRHLKEAEFPPLGARLLATPTPLPVPTAVLTVSSSTAQPETEPAPLDSTTVVGSQTVAADGQVAADRTPDPGLALAARPGQAADLGVDEPASARLIAALIAFLIVAVAVGRRAANTG